MTAFRLMRDNGEVVDLSNNVINVTMSIEIDHADIDAAILAMFRPGVIRSLDPDYDIDGPLRRWDHELEAERRRIGDRRALRQTDAARATVAAEKRRVASSAAAWDDPTRILDEEDGDVQPTPLHPSPCRDCGAPTRGQYHGVDGIVPLCPACFGLPGDAA